MQMQRKAVVSKLLASQNTSNQKQSAADCKNQYKGTILVLIIIDTTNAQDYLVSLRFEIKSVLNSN